MADWATRSAADAKHPAQLARGGAAAGGLGSRALVWTGATSARRDALAARELPAGGTPRWRQSTAVGRDWGVTYTTYIGTRPSPMGSRRD